MTYIIFRSIVASTVRSVAVLRENDERTSLVPLAGKLAVVLRCAAAVVALLFVPAAIAAGGLLRLESSLDAMGTTYTIVAYGEDRYRLQGAIDESFEEVRRLDAMLSNYRPGSEWSRMNREAGAKPFRVTPETFQLLESCMDYSRKSEGAFDVTVGPLMKVWGFYKGTGRLPHRAEIRGALARVGWRKVKLNPEEVTVQFLRSGMDLDPGGIGKGYAVDRVVELLNQRKVHSALISAGGSSIFGLNAPPNESGWKVKIRHPRQLADNPNVRPVAEVVLHNLSMSTSGSAEKHFVSGGMTYSHIFDPRNGYPAQGILSVTVLAPKTIDSEAWTKPVFINGRQWAEENLPRQLRAFICEDKAEQSCAWLR